jgi:hypothetical protein
MTRVWGRDRIQTGLRKKEFLKDLAEIKDFVEQR